MGVCLIQPVHRGGIHVQGMRSLVNVSRSFCNLLLFSIYEHTTRVERINSIIRFRSCEAWLVFGHVLVRRMFGRVFAGMQYNSLEGGVVHVQGMRSAVC